MTEQTPQELIDALDAILDQEREALIKGELQKLEPLLDRKDELIGNLNALESAEQDSMAAVQSKVVRNQALLTSAMEGIRAVAARMSELRKVRKGLDVYNQAGNRSSFSTTGAKALEKRA
jgi:flagellar biosynthesis/type III secretory pathway chaperone